MGLTKKNQEVPALEQLNIYLVSDPEIVKNSIDENGWNVLHHAAANGWAHMVKTLVAELPQLCQSTPDGWNPLMLACQSMGARKRGVYRWDLEMLLRDMYLLGDREILKNNVDMNGWNVLHYAVSNGWVSIVKTLVEELPQLCKSATKNKPIGWTPLMLACQMEKGPPKVSVREEMVLRG